jgi:hypothetical protein
LVGRLTGWPVTRIGGGPTSEPERTISSVRAVQQGCARGLGTALWGHQGFRTRYRTRSRWHSWVPPEGLIMCRNPALWRGFQNIDCGLGSGRSWRLDRISRPLHWILSVTEAFRTPHPGCHVSTTHPATWEIPPKTKIHMRAASERERTPSPCTPPRHTTYPDLG